MIINIDNIFLTLTKEIAVLEACFLLKKQIPTFCYHSDLALEGNCRMCLVEIDKMPKLQVACCLPIQHTMFIKTSSPNVQNARENVLEFLLLQHPLDCPICDQGGECDLQDQSFFYGALKTRYRFTKRSLRTPFYTPKIKLIMTRCINCTRCIRLLKNVFNIMDFGAFNRGQASEVGTFTIFNRTETLFAGNVIDICPVGALTSKPYAFTFRPWELVIVPSLDLLNSYGMTINLEIYKSEIYRITPRYTPRLKLLWISDDIRFLNLKKLNSTPTLQTKFRTKLLTGNTILKTLKILFQLFHPNTLIEWTSTGDLYSLYLVKRLILTQLNTRQTSQANYGSALINFPFMYLFNSYSKIQRIGTLLVIGLDYDTDLLYFKLLLIKEQQTKDIRHLNYGFQRYRAGDHLSFKSSLVLSSLAGLQAIWNFKQILFFFPTTLFTRLDGKMVYFTLARIQTLLQSPTSISLIQKTANAIGARTFGLNTKNSNLVRQQLIHYYSLHPRINTQNFNMLTTHLTQQPNSNIFLSLPQSSPFEYYGQYINNTGWIQKTTPFQGLNRGLELIPFQTLRKLFFQYKTQTLVAQHYFFTLCKQTNHDVATDACSSIFSHYESLLIFKYIYIYTTPLFKVTSNE